MTRRVRIALGAAVVAVVVIGWAGTAAAHATLVATEPAAGSLVTESPDQVTVRFNEPVGIPPEALRLFDSRGKAVAIGRPGHGQDDSRAITATIPVLRNGLYVVAWRAVSADTHPVAGAFTFQVGTGPTGTDAATLIPEVLAENGRHSVVGWTDGAARFALLSTLVLLIGALAFPLATGASVDDGRWRRGCSFIVVAAAVSAGFALVVQVPTSVGAGWSAITQGDAWRAFIQTTAGKAAVVGFVLLVAVAVSFLTTRRTVGLSRTTIGLAAAAILAEALSGHGATGRYQPLGFVLMAGHLAAAGLWVGGLAVLFYVTLRRDDDQTEVIRRFSTLAFDAVVVLVASGVLQAWYQLGSLEELRQSRYGHLLLIKTALVVVMLAVAALSRRVVASRLTLRAAGATPDDTTARRLLHRRVGAELAIAVAVLGVTAALVAANPRAAAASGPISRTLVDRDVIASVTVEPAHVGPNTVHLYLSGPGGSLQQFNDVTIEASNQAKGIGPTAVPLQPAGPDHYIGALTIPFPGTWTVRITALVSEFDERVFTTQINIR